MKKNYIKMNDNNNYLSLGNIFRIIKEVSNNSNAMQTELFCCIFGLNNVNATTINNYCIGIRAIGLEYKNIFEMNYQLYLNDSNIFIDNVLSIISILDNNVYKRGHDSLDIINNNAKLKKVIEKLLTIAINDKSIDEQFINKIKNNSSYNNLIEILYYAIILNKQPQYKQDINIKINKEELNDYLKIKLNFGVSYISSLIDLSRKNNIYACADLGALEFEGAISGKINYKKSYEYYMKAAKKSHPKACWMIANLILTGRVEYDFDTMWKYLNLAIKYGSAAAYNTIGICYLKGINPENKKDINLAKKYFKIASEMGYVFAFNNLGKTYETENNMKEALKYYMISADMNESWALNKVGEYYRNKNDMKKAFIYYNKAIDCPVSERNKYAYYNLAKYYYENGCSEAGVNKNAKLATEFYKKFNE